MILAQASAGNYYLMVQNPATQCEAEQYGPFNIGSESQSSIVSLDTTFITDCINLGRATVNNVSPAGDYTLYLYSPENQVVDTLTGSNGTFDYPIETQGYKVMAVNNATACVSPFAEVIVEDQKVMPEVSSTITHETVCEGQASSNGRISVNISGNATHTLVWYSVSDEQTMAETGTTLSGISAGTYQLTVTNDQTQCQVTHTYEVQNTSEPLTLTVSSSPVTSCSTANGQAFVIANQSENVEYRWYTSSTATDYFVGQRQTALAAGTYYVQAIDLNGRYCPSVVKEVMIREELEDLQVNVVEQYPLTHCDPDDPNAALSANVNGKVIGYRFEWYDGTDTSGEADHIGSTYSELSDSIYTVVAYNEQTGCYNSASLRPSVQLDFVAAPKAEVLRHMTSCVSPNGRISIVDDGKRANYHYRWYYGETVSGQPFIESDQVGDLEAGTYTVTATHRNTGCVSEPVQLVIEDRRTDPEFKIGIQNATCEMANGKVWLEMTNAEDVIVTEIRWFDGFDEFVQDSLTQVPAGNYSVTVTTMNGCTVTRDFTVRSDVKIYNGISANGDGINDKLRITCIENYTNTLKLYNRSGTLVYQVKNYNNDTNAFRGIGNRGIYINGKKLPTGTYFYVIELERKEGVEEDGIYLVNENETVKTGYIELNH